MLVLLGAAALLLCATGLAKIRRPESTRDALHALHLPSGEHLDRTRRTSRHGDLRTVRR